MEKKLIPVMLLSQSIRSEDRYGEQLFNVEGNTLKSENRYGEKLLYFEGNSIRLKDRYGEELYLSYWVNKNYKKIKCSQL